ncbi:hypothetical protein [Acidovorax sp. BLS4]|uniref:hypothetical protein n=1 Tax=Acidovorax sp. BLS4 TaxID=3273430 RepID=UPI002943104F|nr:hypothetical protein [Paracidovorax avenae]WOI45394.1 hypothetical protein R1Z03_23250 [Paracidovorax avenae]
MQATKTPAERSALMDEHMTLMQSGMDMMGAGNSGGIGISVGFLNMILLAWRCGTY